MNNKSKSSNTTCVSTHETVKKAKLRFWAISLFGLFALSILALSNFTGELVKNSGELSPASKLEISSSKTELTKVVPKAETPQQTAPQQSTPNQQSTYTPPKTAQTQANYAPAPAYEPPKDPCNYSLKANYASQRNMAIIAENSNYNSRLAEINSALARMANSGAGDSSAYQQVLGMKGTLISGHSTRLRQIEADYQANIATTGCSL